MKKNIILSIMISISIFFKANGQNNSNTEIDYFESCDTCFKIVKSIKIFDNKNKPCYFTSYYPNGSLKSLLNWYKGVEIGNWFYFHENGKVKKKLSYYFYDNYLNLPLKNTIDTNFVVYSQTRLFLTFVTAQYRNPKVGDVITYYANGSVESISHYKNYKCDSKNNKEIKVGVWKFYNEEGTILLERNYDNNGVFLFDKFY